MKLSKYRLRREICNLKTLEEARNIIDECDKQIVEAFEKRMKAVLDVLAYKKDHKLPIFQPEREHQIFEKINSYLENDKFSNELDLLYRQVLKISKRMQAQDLFPFNIVLIGFMGSGKTSVGKKLSALLEMDYIDTDDLIIKNSKLSVNEIFSRYGEDYFRDLEAQTVKNLQEVKYSIISCGGGIVLNPENIESLKSGGKIIWLKASPQENYNRLLGDTTRPLFQNNLSIDYLTKMLEGRLALYQAASDISIDTDGKNVDEIAMEVIEKLVE